MLAMVVIRIYSLLNGAGDIKKLLLDIFLHSFLIQIWIPNSEYYSTLNGPAWYMCVCVFSYFCFPVVLKYIKSLKNNSQAILTIFFLLLLQIGISILAMLFGNIEENCYFSVKWIIYYCPLTRLIDFCIGCCLGYIFIHRNKTELNNIAFGILQMLVLCGIVVSCYVYSNNLGIFGSQYVKYSLLFTITTVPLIYIVAINKGFISKILSSKIFVIIGDSSACGFLIHNVAIKYCKLVLYKLSLYNSFTIIISSSVVTIITIVLWKNIENRILHQKKRHLLL